MIQETQYDLFISYARENSEWVKTHLYEPLLACVKKDGKRPRIFFDISDKGGIGAGDNFIDSLSNALQHTKKIIPVYSDDYFNKPMPQWELKKAFQLDPGGKNRLINPIFFSTNESLAEKIPFEVNEIQYMHVFKEPNWFARLISNLGLQERGKNLVLEFERTIPDSFVNITIPAIKVTIPGFDPVDGEQEIEIYSDSAPVEGTLIKKTINGMVSFLDLFFSTPAQNVRLGAKATGCQTASSNPFKIFAASDEEKSTIGSAVSSSGNRQKGLDKYVSNIIFEPGVIHTRFFKSGEALSLISLDSILVYSSSGEKLAQIPFSGRIKMIKAGDKLMIVATWQGDVFMIKDDGQNRTFDFAGHGLEFCIPSDSFAFDDQAYIGFWNGDIYHLTFNTEPSLIINHPEGIQAITCLQNRLYFCDLNGFFHILEGGKYLYSREIEKNILGLFIFGTRSMVIIAGRSAYQLQFNKADIFTEALGESSCTQVMRQGNVLIILDEDGKGSVIDEEQIIQSQFHTTAGAIPVCSNTSGDIIVFLYPDGSTALLEDEKIVHIQPSGSICFDPGMKYIAIANEKQIKLCTKEILSNLTSGI